MYNFVFDLDDTLYQQFNLKRPLSVRTYNIFRKYKNEKNKHKKYKYFDEFYKEYTKIFQKDELLNLMLRKIKYPKHIITNSQNAHCYTCLKLLGIRQHFGVILTAETQDKMKPHLSVYRKFDKIKKNKYVNIFFDDKIENLYYPYRENWITVLISPSIFQLIKYKKMKKPDHVYLVFPDIYQSLYFFIKKSI